MNKKNFKLGDFMPKQANLYENKLFEVIRGFDTKFYYQKISLVLEENQYKIRVDKDKEEMVGNAVVTLPNGNRIDYEIRYNRIINLTDGYTLLIPGVSA